jgi:hypothetical protein
MLTEKYATTPELFVCRFDAAPTQEEIFAAVEAGAKAGCKDLIVYIPADKWTGERYSQRDLFNFTPDGEIVSGGIRFQRLRKVDLRQRTVYNAQLQQSFTNTAGIERLPVARETGWGLDL